MYQNFNLQDVKDRHTIKIVVYNDRRIGCFRKKNIYIYTLSIMIKHTNFQAFGTRTLELFWFRVDTPGTYPLSCLRI